jgi:MFS transporter, DHA2 family, multidrug resistance protein
VCVACLAVPLTALAVSSLEPKDIPQGAALNNMMRQLGGSFGISIIDTYYTRRTAVHRTDLISNITAGNPLVTDRVNNFTHYFQSKGATLLDAHSKAIGLIGTEVVKQTSILSYLDAFMLLGALFVITMPLLLFVRTAKRPVAGVVISDH